MRTQAPLGDAQNGVLRGLVMLGGEGARTHQEEAPVGLLRGGCRIVDQRDVCLDRVQGDRLKSGSKPAESSHPGG